MAITQNTCPKCGNSLVVQGDVPTVVQCVRCNNPYAAFDLIDRPVVAPPIIRHPARLAQPSVFLQSFRSTAGMVAAVVVIVVLPMATWSWLSQPVRQDESRLRATAIKHANEALRDYKFEPLSIDADVSRHPTRRELLRVNGHAKDRYGETKSVFIAFRVVEFSARIEWELFLFKSDRQLLYANDKLKNMEF
jgi:uncharacterized protein (DUF983 family)